MLGDVGVTATANHDNSGHTRRRRLSDLDPDKTKYLGASVLFLVRDPRDTVVSGYFQALHRLQLPVASMSDFVRDERHGIEKICHFNNQWFEASSRMTRFAILSYEQMHRSPATALAAVANFAGVDLSAETADSVASNRVFSRMQKAEASGEFAHFGDTLTAGKAGERDSFKVRRGVVGGYKDYFSEDDLAFCDRILAKTNYETNYAQAMSRWGFKSLIHE